MENWLLLLLDVVRCSCFTFEVTDTILKLPHFSKHGCYVCVPCAKGFQMGVWPLPSYVAWSVHMVNTWQVHSSAPLSSDGAGVTGRCSEEGWGWIQTMRLDSQIKRGWENRPESVFGYNVFVGSFVCQVAGIQLCWWSPLLGQEEIL